MIPWHCWFSSTLSHKLCLISNKDTQWCGCILSQPLDFGRNRIFKEFHNVRFFKQIYTLKSIRSLQHREKLHFRGTSWFPQMPAQSESSKVLRKLRKVHLNEASLNKAFIKVSKEFKISCRLSREVLSNSHFRIQ